jgi:hypothetical protein
MDDITTPTKTLHCQKCGAVVMHKILDEPSPASAVLREYYKELIEFRDTDYSEDFTPDQEIALKSAYNGMRLRLEHIARRHGLEVG